MLCGFDKLIAGINYATIGDVSDFYGVNQEYLKNAMNRYGIGHKDLPDDAIVGNFYQFISRFGDEMRKRHTPRLRPLVGVCSKIPGIFYLYDSVTKRDLLVKGDFRCKTTYISARLMLMLSCFLYYGRRIPADSAVRFVFEKLERTSYFEAAKKKSQINSQWRLIRAEPERAMRTAGANSWSRN